MGFFEAASLFVIMTVLALMPSASVALVVARSSILGVRDGVAVSAGIVLGDLVFIGLAILGLSVMAEVMGSLFVAVRYLGAAYLLWFGYALLKAQNSKPEANVAKGKASLAKSFLAGFLLTLGDIKAVFFYASLLPALMDLQALKPADALVVILVAIAIAIASVGGAKLIYVFFARKIMAVSRNTGFEQAARKTAGSLMLGAGAYLLAKS